MYLSATKGHTMHTVDDLKNDLAGAMEDAAGDFPDMHPEEYAFDLIIGVALGSDNRPAAEEFLRRELGYVPDTYKAVLA